MALRYRFGGEQDFALAEIDRHHAATPSFPAAGRPCAYLPDMRARQVVGSRHKLLVDCIGGGPQRLQSPNWLTWPPRTIWVQSIESRDLSAGGRVACGLFAEAGADPADDLVRRCARREDLGNARSLQFVDVVPGHDAAAKD